jgi:hypothetical protein
MTRRQAASVITIVASIGFLGTAAFHSSGYASIVRLAAQAPERVRALLPMLWLGIAFDFSVLGLIVGVMGLRQVGPVRVVLALAAICPFAAAGLQICFIGFILPTAILIAVGVVTLIGAAVCPSPRARPWAGSPDAVRSTRIV